MDLGWPAGIHTRDLVGPLGLGLHGAMPRRRAAERFSDFPGPGRWPPEGASLAQALTALSHPARRALLDVLTVDGPSTVGRLARQLGLAPGSASHHLRVLASAGFIEPAVDLTRDSRESWWRASHRGFQWRSDSFMSGTAGEQLAQAATDQNLEYLMDAMSRWRSASQTRDWDGTVADVLAMATQEELRELGELLSDAMARWADRCRAHSASKPDEERRVVRGVAVVFPDAATPGHGRAATHGEP